DTSHANSGPRRPAPGDIPQSIDVPPTKIVAGFANGRLRKTVDVLGFAMTTTPITVGQYARCVAAGACYAPASDECTNDEAAPPALRSTYVTGADGDGLVLTCATHAQASVYCAWVGGALPTPEEWLLAARGPDVHQYPWGDSVPTCAQHPGARAA